MFGILKYLFILPREILFKFIFFSPCKNNFGEMG